MEPRFLVPDVVDDRHTIVPEERRSSRKSHRLPDPLLDSYHHNSCAQLDSWNGDRFQGRNLSLPIQKRATNLSFLVGETKIRYRAKVTLTSIREEVNLDVSADTKIVGNQASTDLKGY